MLTQQVPLWPSSLATRWLKWDSNILKVWVCSLCECLLEWGIYIWVFPVWLEGMLSGRLSLIENQSATELYACKSPPSVTGWIKKNSAWYDTFQGKKDSIYVSVFVGQCQCGLCTCYPPGDSRIHGKNCECDDRQCEDLSGEVCGGESTHTHILEHTHTFI